MGIVNPPINTLCFRPPALDASVPAVSFIRPTVSDLAVSASPSAARLPADARAHVCDERAWFARDFASKVASARSPGFRKEKLQFLSSKDLPYRCQVSPIAINTPVLAYFVLLAILLRPMVRSIPCAISAYSLAYLVLLDSLFCPIAWPTLVYSAAYFPSVCE